jgi:hypothetical protein
MPPQEFPFNGQNPNNGMTMFPSSSGNMPFASMHNGRDNPSPFGQEPLQRDNMSPLDNNDRNQLQPWNQLGQQTPLPQQQQTAPPSPPSATLDGNQPIRLDRTDPTASSNTRQLQASTSPSINPNDIFRLFFPPETVTSSNNPMSVVIAPTKSASILNHDGHNSNPTPTSTSYPEKSLKPSSTALETSTNTKSSLPNTSISSANDTFKIILPSMILPVLMVLFHLCI